MVAGPIDPGVLSPWLDDDARALAGRGGPSVTRLVAGLLDAGHRVTVATTTPDLVEAGQTHEVSGPDLRVVFGPYRPAGRARDAFAVERDFFATVAGDVDADVHHAHWTYEEALGTLRSRPRAVVTVRDWGPVVLRYHPHPYRVVRLGMQVAALRRARHVVAPSRYMADLADRVHRRGVDVIPNPIDDERVRPEPREGPSGTPRLLGVNNGWGGRKNVAALLQALPAIRRERPDAGLRLVGTGYGEGGPAHQWAREHHVDEAVDFVGRVSLPEVIEEMDRADVFVHPAREESFGNVLVEAMARGTPVVAGQEAGAVPWVVGDGGELVDVRDPTAIAAGVGRLLDDADRWRRCSEAGRRRCSEEFRTTAVVRAHEALYERVVG